MNTTTQIWKWNQKWLREIFEEVISSINFSSYLPTLQEELASFLSQYEISNESIYNCFAKSLKNTPNWNGVLATLNYDNLLDQALINNNILPSTINNRECFDIENANSTNSLLYFFANNNTINELKGFNRENENLFSL